MLLSPQRIQQTLGSKTENVNLQEADRMGFELIVAIDIMRWEGYSVLAALADIVRLQEMQSAFHWLSIMPYDEMESWIELVEIQLTLAPS
jgi:hypothetical protein